jgi:hypothetical protein
MTIDERGTTILLTDKKDNGWYQLQFNPTVRYVEENKEECLEAFEEMVFELRRILDDKFGLIEKQ